MEDEALATKIAACRGCEATNFDLVVDLGMQALTGIFPKANHPDPVSEPLELIICSACQLVQLAHEFNPLDLYGMNYGYRSGLNKSMVRHLREKASNLKQIYKIEDKDSILDIGSNDGTFLGFFTNEVSTLVGCDPTIQKFSNFYDPKILKIPDFFPSEKLFDLNLKFKLVTSIAMFYDLQSPVHFATQIEKLLTEDGVWHFEQSYLPLMLKQVAYDTICHEHLEYYSIKSIDMILRKAGLKMIDARLNEVNGGSIAVDAAKIESSRDISEEALRLRNEEEVFFQENPSAFQDFAANVVAHKAKLNLVIQHYKSQGKEIWGVGASTKGNVILQYCNLDSSVIKGIIEVNEDKFGCVTPSTRIPILPESELPTNGNTVAVVFPWHFKSGIIERSKLFLDSGGTLVFPLPEVVEVNSKGEFRL